MNKLTPAQKALYLVPFKKLKDSKAWKLTSEYVRKKGARITREGVWNQCYTCKNWFPFNKLVAGHSDEKIGHASTYFDLDGLRPQDYRCNRKLHGDYARFTMNLIEEIGIERVKQLRIRAGKSKVWTLLEIEKLAEERKKMLEEL